VDWASGRYFLHPEYVYVVAHNSRRWSNVRLVATLLSSLPILLAVQGSAQGQMPRQEPEAFWNPPVLGRDLASRLTLGAEPLELPAQSRTPRILMYGMLPGFLSDPIGMNTNDDPVDVNSVYAPGTSDDSFKSMLVSIGNHNPYFDLRRAGDPGGVGYMRLHSQLQLVDLPTTSVCFGVQGWTPAGYENGGVGNGPTTISPGLGIFQDLGNGTAFHGYIGQNFRDGCNKDGPLRCGMAVHCPLVPWAEPEACPVYLFVQALGSYTYAGEQRQGRVMNWDVMPGIHMRLNDNFWLSIGGTRSTLLTWMWQF
jgi:hypothetical protein